MRYIPFAIAILLVPVGLLMALDYPAVGYCVAAIGLCLSIMGVRDVVQLKRAVLRNYPISARSRFLLETFRPEIRQYFLERDHDETPS